MVDNKGALSVKVLSNFGLDVEQSFSKGFNIYKGFVLELDASYRLDTTDRFWLHPQLMKTRKLFRATEEGTKEKVASMKFDISNCASSTALYTTHEFDEIGGYKEQDYVIVDTSNDDVAIGALTHWMNAKSELRDVYNEMHTMKVDGKTLQEHTEELIGNISKSIEGLELVSSSSYNVFYRANNSFLFYNHALKCNSTEEKALVHISPLMGYALCKSRGQAFESDLMSSSNYLDISKFTEEQRRRAYVSCRWDGKNIVNTFCLRKPIENWKQWFGEENITTYRMETGYFSNTPIVDKLDPKVVLFLTPEATAIPEEKEIHSHIKKNIVKLPATDELLVKLAQDHWKQVFSKKYQSGDSLALPRELLLKLI